MTPIFLRGSTITLYNNSLLHVQYQLVLETHFYFFQKPMLWLQTQILNSNELFSSLVHRRTPKL